MDFADAARAALVMSGTGLLSYGAWLLQPAAGFITGGTVLLILGVAATLRAGKA